MIHSRSGLATLAGLLFSALSAICSANCANGAERAPLPAVAPAGSLYERLGGTAKVTAIVDGTIERVAHDPLTSHAFEKVNLKRVKSFLAEFICSRAGGGCSYTGDTMKEIHAGQHITNAQFYQLVETLREEMRAQDIPLGARNELLAILAPMKRDVVER